METFSFGGGWGKTRRGPLDLIPTVLWLNMVKREETCFRLHDGMLVVLAMHHFCFYRINNIISSKSGS